MTPREFQHTYQSYRTSDGGEALREAIRVNREEGIEGDVVIPVNFGSLGWGLMLESSHKFLRDIFPAFPTLS